MSNIAQEQASVLVQHFAEAASSVLSQVSGTALQAQPSLLDTATEAATLIRIAISGALEGVCEIALSAPMTAQFAALLTGETPDPAAEISADLREAAAELMQQICGNAADRLRRAFGPLELKPQPSERDSESGARHIFLVARDPVSSDQDALNRLWGEYFRDSKPATTTVQVVRLATDPRCLVEINAIAVVD